MSIDPLITALRTMVKGEPDSGLRQICHTLTLKRAGSVRPGVATLFSAFTFGSRGQMAAFLRQFAGSRGKSRR